MGEGRKRRRRKQDCRGFTLVEIIVVLVILAILAAFTIPAMLGFVNDARGKAYIVEAREIYTAMQSALTEVGAQQTETNKITTKVYRFCYTMVAVDGKGVYKTVIKTNGNDPNDGKYSNNSLVGTKALALIGKDIIITSSERTTHFANIYINPENLRVTKIEYYKKPYTITIDSISNSTTIKFVNDARGKAYIASARECYIAAQSASTEVAAANSGTLTANDTTQQGNISSKIVNQVTNDITGVKVSTVIGATTATDPNLFNNVAVAVSTDGTVKQVIYCSPDNKYKITITPNQGGSSADITKR